MKLSKISVSLAALMTVAVGGVALAANPMVGGAAMFETKNIVENAVNSKDHTTLVAAVKAAGLVYTLASPGPFTVFAPTNAAFAKPVSYTHLDVYKRQVSAFGRVYLCGYPLQFYRYCRKPTIVHGIDGQRGGLET